MSAHGRSALTASALAVFVLAAAVGAAAGAAAKAAVLAAGAGIVLSGAAHALARSQTRRHRQARSAAAEDLLAAFAAEVAAGAAPEAAFGTAACASPAALPELASVAGHTDHAAGGPPTALCVSNLPTLRQLAAGWRVSTCSGTRLAPLAARLCAGAQAAGARDRELRAALAGPRASGRLVAGLPFVATGMGVAMGATPHLVLFDTGAGLACLVIGMVCDLAGLAWMNRIADRVERSCDGALVLRGGMVDAPPGSDLRDTPRRSPSRSRGRRGGGPARGRAQGSPVRRPARAEHAAHQELKPPAARPGGPRGTRQIAQRSVGQRSVGQRSVGHGSRSDLSGTRFPPPVARGTAPGQRFAAGGDPRIAPPSAKDHPHAGFGPAAAPRLEPATAATAAVLGAAVLGIVMVTAGAGHLVAPVLGMCVAGLALAAFARMRTDPARIRHARLVADIPIALDLIAACLAAGAAPHQAQQVVGEAVAGPLGAELLDAASALRSGQRPREAFSRLLEHSRTPSAWARLWPGFPARAGAPEPAVVALVEALHRSEVSGARLATTLERVADRSREEAHMKAIEAARRAGVAAAAPLGLCFLPAFLLLGVVPVILATAPGVLTS